MPDELDIIEVLSLQPASPAVHSVTNSTQSPPDIACLEVVIDRDLAVQLVGSDAGKERRMRPHGAMTKGASAEELADVGAVMDPFLNDEIRRVHEGKTHRPKLFHARATPTQATSLKAFCVRFAVSLKMNLEKHPGDDNRHRSQQRLKQARGVIAQINTALGISLDGLTLERDREELIARLAVFSADIGRLCERAAALGKPETVRLLLAIQDALSGLTGPIARI